MENYVKFKAPTRVTDMVSRCHVVNGITSCSFCRRKGTCREFISLQELKRIEEKYNGVNKKNE